MEWYYILLICVGAVAIVLALLLSFSLTIYSLAFGVRRDKNPLLKYYTAEDFSLSEEKVEVGRGKRSFCGRLYTKGGVEQSKTLVIFCHGIGPGHCAYMAEINYFCERGYTALALDSRGCGLSGGKSMEGMYAGVRTAKTAVKYARAQRRFDGYKICLVGHSWGAYSVLCASSEVKVDGVVAISAFDTPLEIMRHVAAEFIPPRVARSFSPFWTIADFVHFGSKSNKSAAKSASGSGVPTLLIQGDIDKSVPMDKSAYAHASGGNIIKYLAEGKAHNPYFTFAAQEKFMELSEHLDISQRKNMEVDKEYFDTFDFVAATEEDKEVMSAIGDFIEKLQLTN